MPGVNLWRLRARTIEAMVMLIAARMAVTLIPLKCWKRHLGLGGAALERDLAEARRLARHVERAAARLPFEIKCLPQAIALSRMLRRRAIAHSLILAARPARARTGHDDLHAWIEFDNAIVLGALAGPWLELLRLPRTIR